MPPHVGHPDSAASTEVARGRAIDASPEAPAQEPPRLLSFLEEEVWPQIPADQLGECLSRAEREAILGYGPQGV